MPEFLHGAWHIAKIVIAGVTGVTTLAVFVLAGLDIAGWLPPTRSEKHDPPP